MRAIENDEPDVPVQAVQMVGGFTCQGRRWPRGSWIVHVPGLPAHRLALTNEQFRQRFTLITSNGAAAAA